MIGAVLQHRDLKSPNILLSREGVAKIGDVGLMKAQVSPWEADSAAPLCHAFKASPPPLRQCLQLCVLSAHPLTAA